MVSTDCIHLQDIQDAILTKSADVELVNSLGENYKNLTDPAQADIIADKLEELNKKWDWLLGLLLCSLFFILNSKRSSCLTFLYA